MILLGFCAVELKFNEFFPQILVVTIRKYSKIRLLDAEFVKFKFF
jgi:hypothetical protein